MSSGGSTKTLAKKYFSEIGLQSAKELYEMYQADFEMFGYSPDMYFDIASKWNLLIM